VIFHRFGRFQGNLRVRVMFSPFPTFRPFGHRFSNVSAVRPSFSHVSALPTPFLQGSPDLHRNLRDRGARVTFSRLPPFRPIGHVFHTFSHVSTRLATFSRRFCPIPTATAMNRTSGHVDPSSVRFRPSCFRFPPFRPFRHGFSTFWPCVHRFPDVSQFPTVTAVNRAAGACWSICVRSATFSDVSARFPP
jgi:hypothetical protein